MPLLKLNSRNMYLVVQIYGIFKKLAEQHLQEEEV
jgi:hypothetical protein